MKHSAYLIVCLVFLFVQCKKSTDPPTPSPEQNKIDVLTFKVPGVDDKNIRIGKNFIEINLPENYDKGDFIKPEVKFGNGYSSSSEILNGFSFQGKALDFTVSNPNIGSWFYHIVVIPHNAIELKQPPQNFEFAIGPEVIIRPSFDLNGTLSALDDKDSLVRMPVIRLTDESTGKVVSEKIYVEERSPSNDTMTNFILPSGISPGEYSAELVWGKKTELLTSKIVLKSGKVKIQRGSWRKLSGDRSFSIPGFNLSSTSNYEAIIGNDFETPKRVNLKLTKPGILSGELPEGIGIGNYRMTYLVDGKEVETYDQRNWFVTRTGDDQFYIQSIQSQPILRIITQSSQKGTLKDYNGFFVDFYKSITEINRHEPILAYTESWGVGQNKTLVLVNRSTKVEYSLGESPDYRTSLMDGYVTFYHYPIPDKVPSGTYEAYVVRDLGDNITVKTERYSQILTIK